MKMTRKYALIYWSGYALVGCGIPGIIAVASVMFFGFCEPQVTERKIEISAQIDEYRKSLDDNSSVEALKGDLIALYKHHLITRELHSHLIIGLGLLGVGSAISLAGAQMMLSARIAEIKNEK